MQTMLDANVSALAMVNDDTDTIVGNFSVSDIRTLGVAPRTSWGDLLRGPAIDFIRAARETAVAGGGAVFRDAAGVCGWGACACVGVGWILGFFARRPGSGGFAGGGGGGGGV